MLDMQASTLTAVAFLFALSACTGASSKGSATEAEASATSEDDSGAATTTAMVASTDAVTSFSTTGSGSTSNGASSGTGDGEIAQCETWSDMCPRGTKCIPYDNVEAGTRVAQGCFPIVEMPGKQGDPCQAQDFDAMTLDTCDKGLVCWESKCVPLCQGSPGDFVCVDDALACLVYNDFVVAICLPNCDPRMPDCLDGEACIRLGSIFKCEPRIDTRGVFSPCSMDSQCAAGLMCGVSSVAIECDQNLERCCTPVCSTDLPAECPGNGQSCVPLADLANVPEYQSLGMCRV